MRRAEGVADEELIAERGELAGEILVVRFFFGVIADIFEEQHVAVFQRAAFGFGFGPDAIRGEVDRLAEEFCEAGGDRLQRVFRVGLAFGAARCDARTSRAP